jgi:hypothetical protein
VRVCAYVQGEKVRAAKQIQDLRQKVSEQRKQIAKQKQNLEAQHEANVGAENTIHALRQMIQTLRSRAPPGAAGVGPLPGPSATYGGPGSLPADMNLNAYGGSISARPTYVQQLSSSLAAQARSGLGSRQASAMIQPSPGLNSADAAAFGSGVAISPPSGGVAVYGGSQTSGGRAALASSHDTAGSLGPAARAPDRGAPMAPAAAAASRIVESQRGSAASSGGSAGLHVDAAERRRPPPPPPPGHGSSRGSTGDSSRHAESRPGGDKDRSRTTEPGAGRRSSVGLLFDDDIERREEAGGAPIDDPLADKDSRPGTPREDGADA